tara:strand:- start:975 stop:1166 length:192 start_codon:yes stop_codon:yes gene_type:complete
MEDLDVNNIIEIKEIRKLISHKKNLLEIFDEIIQKVNIKINDKDSSLISKVVDVASETDSDSD